MNQIIELLADRNLHLEKFYELTEDQLAEIASGNFDNLDFFYSQREGILDLVKCIDCLIQKEMQDHDLGAEIRLAAVKLVKEKEMLVKKIVTQDLQVLELIEQLKSSLIRELATIKAGRKALNSYQSGQKSVNESLKSEV